jgi:tetratricopeptide (TPR) repeat protein
VDPVALYSLIEEGMKWYLDCGGRASRIELSLPTTLADVVGPMGFKPSAEAHKEAVLLREHAPSHGHRVILSCDAAALRAHCEARAGGQKGAGNPHVLHDIAGRLAHDLGDPKGAIKPYTTSLQANPQSAAVFRNMGAAYHAQGDMQLAFASYQQAVQLDESDALVYLKLAFFYEDYASKDWIDAADHAQKCYEYYLDKVDRGDTSVMTRLGNLLVREHRPERAVEVYARALEVDPGLENVWFNKAHAQMTVGDVAGAAESLRKTLEIDPTVVAARHMLKVG